jgi:hypothetical protein
MHEKANNFKPYGNQRSPNLMDSVVSVVLVFNLVSK